MATALDFLPPYQRFCPPNRRTITTESTLESWQDLYLAAAQETDPDRVQERVTAARAWMKQLLDDAPNSSEPEQIENARFRA